MRDSDVCQMNICKNMNGMSFVRDLQKLIYCISKGMLPSGKAAMKKMWMLDISQDRKEVQEYYQIVSAYGDIHLCASKCDVKKKYLDFDE